MSGQFQNKRQRERQKQQKKADKEARKQERRASSPDEAPETLEADAAAPGPELLPLMSSLDESVAALQSRLPELRSQINRQTEKGSAAMPAGRTALMYAASKGNMAAIQVLLDEGADPALKDSLGETAASLARKRLRYGPQFAMIVKMLEEPQ
ncbi:MAG: hypothetical protein HS115_19335 [Spirochaetales bacterium]|nr:hypothetical protein [Spirochaetales bacterium]